MYSEKHEIMGNHPASLEKIKYDFCLATEKLLYQFKDIGYYNQVLTNVAISPEFIVVFNEDIFDFVQKKLTKMNETMKPVDKPVNIETAGVNDYDNNKTWNLEIIEIVKEEPVCDDNNSKTDNNPELLLHDPLALDEDFGTNLRTRAEAVNFDDDLDDDSLSERTESLNPHSNNQLVHSSSGNYSLFIFKYLKQRFFIIKTVNE